MNLKTVVRKKTVAVFTVSMGVIFLCVARCANDTLFDAAGKNWNKPFAFVSASNYSSLSLADTALLKLTDTLTVVQNASFTYIGLISNPRPGIGLKGAWDFGNGQGESAVFDSFFIARQTFTDTGRFVARFTIRDALGDEASDSVTVNVLAQQKPRPVSIELLSPPNGMMNINPAESLGVFFSWRIVTSYPADSLTATVYLGKDTASLTTIKTGVKSGIVVSDLNYTTRYYWRIVAFAGSQPIDTSLVFTFVTKSGNLTGGPVIEFIRGDTTAFAGDTVPFFASVKDSGSAITMYAWDFNNDSIFEIKSGTTATCTYVYTDTGHFKAIFRAVDVNDKSVLDTVRITIISKKPIAGPVIRSIRKDTTVTARDPVRFFAAASDSSAPIVEYAWDFDGNGTWDNHDSTTAGSDSITYSFVNPGKYNAILRVTDKNGKTAYDTAKIIVLPINSLGSGPVIMSVRHDTTVSLFDTVAFFATVIDSTCPVTEYAWDFNGNDTFECVKTLPTDTCKHRFTATRVYKTVFRATDSLGKTTYDTVRITVAKIKLRVNFISPDTIVDFHNTVRCSVVVNNASVNPVFEIDTMQTGVFRPMNAAGAIGTYAFRVDTAAVSDSVRIRVYSALSDTVTKGFKVSVRPRSLTITAIDSTDTTITVRWTKTLESGFKEYLIYRGVTADVDTNGNLWATVDQAATTLYATPTPNYNLLPRYYRIYQRDKNGFLSAGSNIVFGNIKNSAPTRPVFVYPLKAADTLWSNGTMRWSRSTDNNNDSVTYDLLFNQNNAGFVTYARGIQDTMYRLVGIDSLPSFKANIRVVARDGHGGADSSTLNNVFFRQARSGRMFVVPKGTFIDSANNLATITYDYLMDSIEVTQLSYKNAMNMADPSVSIADNQPV